MQQRRRLEKHTVGTIMAIGAEARANGALTEAEHLAARAGVDRDVAEAVTQRRVRLRPDNTAVEPISAAEGARRMMAILEEHDDDLDEVVTQRRARLRPDNTAVAPLSAAEIARRFREED